MRAEPATCLKSWLPSAAARERMLALRGEPFLFADWLDVVFLHYAVDPDVLQPLIPWPLDLRDGRAYVSLVAFTMRDMHPRAGGRIGALLFRPIATHPFLNARTYVVHEGEPGIHFLAEWLPNSLSVALGPTVFGLPYRKGGLDYQNEALSHEVRGRIVEARSGASLSYHADITAGVPHQACDAGSLDEFLLERYIAFNSQLGLARCFRIWHPPWPVAPLDARVEDCGLLAQTGVWSSHADLIGAHHSHGFPAVWMGRPRFLDHKTSRL